MNHETTKVGGPLSAAQAQPGFDAVDGFRKAKAAMQEECADLMAARAAKKKAHVEELAAIDKRIAAIHVALGGDRKPRTPKAKP